MRDNPNTETQEAQRRGIKVLSPPLPGPSLLACLSLFLCFSCGSILEGCNRGLAPVQTSSTSRPGFGGTIRFVSAWPPPDSVQDLRVVAFDNYPPTNIFGEVTSGQAKVFPAIGSPGLTKFVDSLSYKFDLDSAETFQYVVVAMQYGSNALQDWKVVGAFGYSHGQGSPQPVTVPPNSFVNGIDLEVDFKNTPPTPLNGIASPAPRH
jgi:hypothetical protein